MRKYIGLFCLSIFMNIMMHSSASQNTNIMIRDATTGNMRFEAVSMTTFNYITSLQRIITVSNLADQRGRDYIRSLQQEIAALKDNNGQTLRMLRLQNFLLTQRYQNLVIQNRELLLRTQQLQVRTCMDKEELSKQIQEMSEEIDLLKEDLKKERMVNDLLK